MLRNAENLGVKVVVKDSGSNEKFLNAVAGMSNIILVQNEPGGERKSMGNDRRGALEKAMQIAEQEKIEHPCFFWTEPEKDNLISAENLSEMASEIAKGSNIVVPARKAEALETLPKIQRWFEQRANKRSLKVMEEATDGRHHELLDLWFGPKMFDSEGAKYFTEYNKDNDRTDLWDAIIVPVTKATKDGKKVSSVPVEYKYGIEEPLELKRLEQYAQILREMGDKKWVEFFEEANEELAAMREVKKELKADPRNAELTGQEKKLKTEIVKKFQNWEKIGK